MRFALAFLGSEKWVVEKGPKITTFRGGDIKWRMRATFGSCGLNLFSCAKSSSVTLTAGEMGFALAFLGSEKWVVKKRLKNGVLGTLRCRQIGRRGLNRKTVMIDRFLVPNYPPVQIFSEKYDKMSQGTLWVFLYQYKWGPRKTPPGEIWAILNRRKYFKKIETMPTKNIAGNGNGRFSTFLIF